MRCLIKEIEKYSANGREITSLCLDVDGEDAKHVKHVVFKLFTPSGDMLSVGDVVDVTFTPIEQKRVADPEKPADTQNGGLTKTLEQVGFGKIPAYLDIEAGDRVVLSKPTNVDPEKPADAQTPASDSTTKQDASPAPEKPADSTTPPAA